jgi:hypothetical protein
MRLKMVFLAKPQYVERLVVVRVVHLGSLGATDAAGQLLE